MLIIQNSEMRQICTFVKKKLFKFHKMGSENSRMRFLSDFNF